MIKRTMMRTSWMVVLAVVFLTCSFQEVSAARRIVVSSPLTKLLENGFTADQVVDLLAEAGINGLRKNQVYKDPMEGLSGLEDFTDDQVALLQASSAVKLLFLRLGSEEWGPGNEGELPYLVEAVQMVQNCLNRARYQEVYNQLNPTLKDFAAPLTIDHLISATNNLTEALTLWARNGEIADPVAECDLLTDSLSELALHYYVLENRGNAAIEEAIGYDILPNISGTQYPQVDLGGLVTIYNADGSVATTDVGSQADSGSGTDSGSATDPAVYPAAILDSVKGDGSSFVLSWSLPAGTSDVPSGGYDIIIDGVDTGTEWRTDATSITITGLETGVTHTFQVQARWLQAEPDQVPLSSELSATISVDVPVESLPVSYPAAILDSVEVDGSSFVLSWSLPAGTSEVPSGGYDIIIDGVDTGSDWRTDRTSAVISGLGTGVAHTFQIQARWLQADPDQVPLSNELSGTIPADSSTVTEPVEVPVYEPPVVETPADGNLRVFPGAEGFGTETKAGRGGKIIHVTNLNDSGTGSLRAALEYPSPRIVVFDVGGVIRLQRDISINSPYITVAGQTAPGDGIMIRDYGLRISTHDVLIQHVAIRVGDDGRSRDGSWDNQDCLQILGGYNIVIDHVSASWGIDENMSVWASNVHDLTFSHCLIAEGLQNSVHSEGRHSKGLLIGGNGNNPKNVAIIKNLFAHNHERNPQLKGGVTAVVANNLTYNSNNEWSWFVTSRDKVDETNKGYYVGNVGKDGPDSVGAMFIKISSSILSGSQIYEDDNMNVSRPSSSFKDGAGVMVNSAPISFLPHYLLSSDEAMSYVLYEAGARPAFRDEVDDRIANPVSGEVVRGTGTIRDHSAGLWPSYANVYQPFAYGSNPNGDDDGDGYTNIEERIHEAAALVEGR